MGVESITCWKVTCDYPGCSRETSDLGEFGSYEDQAVAIVAWRQDAGVVKDDGVALCDEHALIYARCDYCGKDGRLTRDSGDGDRVCVACRNASWSDVCFCGQHLGEHPPGPPCPPPPPPGMPFA